MVDRIRQLLAWQQLSPTQFADLIGVGRPVISHILSERNKPSLEVVQRIVGAFPVISLPWLLSGAGDMLASDPAPTSAPQIATVPAPVAAPIAAPLPAAVAAPAVSPAPRREPATPPAAAPLAPPPAARFVVATQRQPAPFMARPQLPLAPAAAQPLPPSEPALLVANESPVPPAGKPDEIPPVGASLGLLQPAAAAPVAPASSAPTAPGDTAVLASLLAEPTKAIRRIVIFYRDGSFADYVPEG